MNICLESLSSLQNQNNQGIYAGGMSREQTEKKSCGPCKYSSKSTLDAEQPTLIAFLSSSLRLTTKFKLRTCFCPRIGVCSLLLIRLHQLLLSCATQQILQGVALKDWNSPLSLSSCESLEKDSFLLHFNNKELSHLQF